MIRLTLKKIINYIINQNIIELRILYISKKKAGITKIKDVTLEFPVLPFC